jgi:salicylate hydroxylase
MDIAIIGAGIGGLTAAAALTQKGAKVAVFEQADEIRQPGAGITIGGNAARVLNRLGHGSLRERSGVESTAALMRYWEDGRVLAVGMTGGQEAPPPDRPYTVHRADLSQELASAVPPEALHFGRQCVSAEEDANGITAEFADGSTIRADVLIAADGLHSRLRRQRVTEPSAIYSGWDVIRGLVPAADVGAQFAGLTESWAWLGPGRFVLCYAVRSGQLINVVASFPGDQSLSDEWNARQDDHRAAVIGAFAGWDNELVRVLERMEITGRWGLVDREPVTGWSSERMTLLGDAAHPMLPLYGQGANQAIEDGYVLAECLEPVLAGTGDIGSALQRYASIRVPRTAAIQLGSRANANGFYSPDGDPATIKTAAVQLTGQVDANYRKVYGHKVEEDLHTA